jgi:pyruvyltransferase
MNKIPTYWWKGKNNFGDILSPIVVRNISNKEVYYTAESKKLLAIGSVIQFASPKDIIWGAGYIGAGDISKDLKIYAVRGPKTREILLKNEIECPTVYGDPAILIKDIYKEYFSTLKEYKYGIIPHFRDYKKTVEYINDSKINVIDILSGIENVIVEATKCDILFSSSLHGIILGESYNIPTVWVTMGERETYFNQFTTDVNKIDFKFVDYYLYTDRDKQVKVDWSNGINISSAKNVIKSIEIPKFNYNALIDSFPHEEFNGQ